MSQNGTNMNELIQIKTDLFDIAKRLKEIDNHYKLYYNNKLKRYEVHAYGALQCVVPYKYLDARTLLHIRKTRIENREVFLKELEEENLIKEKIQQIKAKDKMSAYLCDEVL